MNNTMGVWYNPLSWGNEKKIETKISESKAREYGIKAMKRFWSVNASYGYKASFPDFIKLIDSLSPSWLKYYGESIEMLISDGTWTWTDTYDIMDDIGNESKGKIFIHPFDLEIFFDALKEGQTDFSNIIRWSASDVVADIKDATVFIGAWAPKVMLLAGILGGAYILYQIKPLIKQLTK